MLSASTSNGNPMGNVGSPGRTFSPLDPIADGGFSPEGYRRGAVLSQNPPSRSRVLQKTIGKVFLAEKAGQWMVSIKIELQPEGSPGRHPQIAQPQIFKDEVEVVVDALGFRPSEKRPAGLLVMPGFERRTGFQGGEDRDQPGMVPTLAIIFLIRFSLRKSFSRINSISKPLSRAKRSAWRRISSRKGSVNWA